MANIPFLVDINLNKNELQNAKFQNATTPPAATTGGDYGLSYYHTGEKKLYIWNGTAWITSGDSTSAAQSIKGNNTDSVANTIDLTVTQATAMLNKFGTSTNGLVPAPTSTNLNNYLKGDGTWGNPTGTFAYPTAGIPISTGTGWGTSIPDNHLQWDTAYTQRATWDGVIVGGGLTADKEKGRLALGGTIAGSSMFISTGPTVNGTYFPKFTITSSGGTSVVGYEDAATYRTSIGAGTSSTTYAFATGTTNGTFIVTPTVAGVTGSAQTVPIFGLGSNAYNSTAFLTANQTITLSGDVSGSGTTSITTALATITQGNTGSFVKVALDTKGRVTGNTPVVIGDITGLLGTTYYLSTNPNGYTSNVGDMVLATQQIVTASKTFNDSTLLLKGTGGGVATITGNNSTATTLTLPGSSGTIALTSDITSAVTGALSYQGGYDASVTPPATAKKGYTYTVTVAGNGNNFFSAANALPVGDMVISEKDNPTIEADWTTVNKNIPDIVAATSTVAGIIKLVTNIKSLSESDTAVTPASLKDGINEYLNKTGSSAVAGTGIVIQDSSVTLTSSKIWKGTIGNGTIKDFAITHAIDGGAPNPTVVIKDNFNTIIQTQVVITSPTVVTISFNVAPTNNQYLVYIKA